MEKFKEYAQSTAITFVAAFVFAVAPMIGDVPFEQGAIFGLVLAGFRAGVKAVFDLASVLLAAYRTQ